DLLVRPLDHGSIIRHSIDPTLHAPTTRAPPPNRRSSARVYRPMHAGCCGGGSAIVELGGDGLGFEGLAAAEQADADGAADPLGAEQALELADGGDGNVVDGQDQVLGADAGPGG